MKVQEDIRDIFSMLHDGSISAWNGDKNLLTLTVNCEYLAERMDKTFDKFYLELIEIDKLELAPWLNSVELPAATKTDLPDIFKAELEIMSAEVKDDFVLVTCLQSNTDYDYSGGNLSVSCKSIKVFDQGKNELTIEKLDKLCNDYWEEWSK